MSRVDPSSKLSQLRKKWGDGIESTTHTYRRRTKPSDAIPNAGDPLDTQPFVPGPTSPLPAHGHPHAKVSKTLLDVPGKTT